MKKNKYLCIIQARSGSTRLPGKILKTVSGVSLLEYGVLRIRQAKRVDQIVIATTTEPGDDAIANLCEKIGVSFVRGSEKDVLDRHAQAIKEYPDYNCVVRITSDCPLIDPRVIDDVIDFFEKGDYDYVNNNFLDDPAEESFPEGMDVEVIKTSVLLEAAAKATMSSEREHVTPYIRNNPKYKKAYFTTDHDFSHIRLSVDYPQDFEVIEFLIQNSKITDDYLTYVSLLTKHPEVLLKNIHIEKNQWYYKSLEHDSTFKP